jgi:hypothetical protein
LITDCEIFVVDQFHQLFLFFTTVYVVCSAVELEPQEPQLFALAEPEPECIRAPDPKIKDYKRKKFKNEGPTFWETMLLLTLKNNTYFVQIFRC